MLDLSKLEIRTSVENYSDYLRVSGELLLSYGVILGRLDREFRTQEDMLNCAVKTVQGNIWSHVYGDLEPHFRFLAEYVLKNCKEQDAPYIVEKLKELRTLLNPALMDQSNIRITHEKLNTVDGKLKL